MYIGLQIEKGYKTTYNNGTGKINKRMKNFE